MFAEKLKGKIYVSDEDIEGYVFQLINEIIHNGQTHGRTAEQLAQHVTSGVVLEVAALQALGGALNTTPFDPKVPSSYNYDLEVNGKKFEIKSSPPKDKWLNFNLKSQVNANIGKLIRADYSVYTLYYRQLDYLLVGSSVKVEGGHNVKFKWLIHSPSFSRFVKNSRRSHTGKGTTNYYHIPNAITEGACIVI